MNRGIPSFEEGLDMAPSWLPPNDDVLLAKGPTLARNAQRMGLLLHSCNRLSYATAFVLAVEAWPLAAGFARKFNRALLTSSA